jgi:CheY-like chemotaxis protein
MIRVWLIDDDNFSNFLNNKLLDIYWPESEVTAMTKAREALELLKTDRNIPQLILLDIRMPEMNGIEFLEHFVKLDATLTMQIKIIMLSSSLDHSDIEKSLSFDSVTRFMNKPLGKEKIEDLKVLLSNG